ncbi:MAG: helix-turn-helix transcriptional regulator [Robiginitomaculum sp.]|nr:helix-turn-helix transcriptional regulator [Robiginitomaculum sp.]
MSTKREMIKGNICGFNIRELRKKLGMAQVDLAEALNVDFGYAFDQSDISEIERKFRGVKDHELKALASVLETTSDNLLS